VYADSDGTEHSLALVVKRATNLTLAQLVGTWDSYQIEINLSGGGGGGGGGEDPKNGVVNTFHEDGTTLAIRETWVNDKLHGEPAFEQWDELGNPTVAENYTNGGLTKSTNSSYHQGSSILAHRRIYVDGELHGEPARQW
jgi:hypothetical protein